MTDQARIAELEQALRLHLAIGPDDPLIIDPVERQLLQLQQDAGRLAEALLEEIECRYQACYAGTGADWRVQMEADEAYQLAHSVLRAQGGP